MLSASLDAGNCVHPVTAVVDNDADSHTDAACAADSADTAYESDDSSDATEVISHSGDCSLILEDTHSWNPDTPSHSSLSSDPALVSASDCESDTTLSYDWESSPPSSPPLRLYSPGNASGFINVNEI